LADVVVYTWTVCPYCVRAKDFLKRKGVAFREINLDGKDRELAALRDRTKFRTVPQIFIGDKFIGGYMDLVALEDAGELDKLLTGQSQIAGPESQPPSTETIL
jgi:glutaredoxin 3